MDARGSCPQTTSARDTMFGHQRIHLAPGGRAASIRCREAFRAAAVDAAGSSCSCVNHAAEAGAWCAVDA